QARRHDGRQGAGHLACCEALKQPGRQGAARLLQLRPRCRQRAGRLAAGTLAAGSAPPRLDGCAGGRALAVMPADASTMATTAVHCIRVSVSPRNISPDTAANTGSRLSKVPKMRTGMRVSTVISRA